MQGKSDIESILETQTWKFSALKSKTSVSPVKLPQKLSPLIQKTATSLSPRLSEQTSPCPNEESPRRRSILAIPLASFTSKLNLIVKDDDLFYMKIPSFPKLPFANHTEMLGKVPKFELLPKDTVIDSDNVKNIKIESGRIKRGTFRNYLRKTGKIKFKAREKWEI